MTAILKKQIGSEIRELLSVKPEWHFNKVNPRFKNREATQGEFFASDSELRALVREAVQNSLDARRPGYNGPVAVRFYLSGRERALSPKAARRYFRGGWEHFLSEKSGLRDAPGPEDRCCFFVCEDSGTTGLTGDVEQFHEIPGQRNAFYYFFRAEGQSNKTEAAHEQLETGRGRWGLGKFVFPRSSRIRTFFGLTVRHDDQRRLLVGQSILRSHQVDDTSYTPDGWFGKKPGKKEAAAPVEDDDFLDEFEEDFCLERGDDSGLSIVVPYCDPEWSITDILNCVVQDYFYAVLTEQLVITAESSDGHFVIQANSLPDVLMHCEHSVQEQIRPLLELTVWAAEQRRTAQILTLSGAAAKGAPRWDRRTLDATVFEKIQQEFQAHGRVAVRVPLNVQERSRDSQATFFDLFLERCESSQHKRPVFIRDSLIISDVRCRLMRDICAIVSAEDQVLCQFLGDAENPAHTEWLEESSHFKGRYVHGAATLRFVRNAAADLGQMLQEVPEPEDVELLLDVFSIGTRLEGMPVEFQSRTSRGGLSGSNFRVSRGLSQRDASRGSARSKPWRVTRRKGGFRLAGQLETGSRMEGSIEVAVAYDRRSGNPLRNFSAADFRLDLPPIQIESEGADVQLAGANRLFVYAEATEFSVTVTGFDVNRDLFLQTVFRPANPSGELIN